jgi:hypothetical protein
MKVITLLFVFLFLPTNIVLAYEYTSDVSLSLSEQYNDNIFLSRDRVSDFITFITPGIGLSIKSSNSELKLGYSPSFSFYSSHTELNETSHHFTADGSFTLSERLSLLLRDTFVKSSEISDIRAVPDLGPITARREVRLHTLNSNISYRLRDNLSYMLGVSYFDTDYKEKGLIEVKTYSGNMGISYIQSKRTTFTANARYIKYDYRPFSDVTGQDYSLGITHRLNPTLTIGLTGGAIITKIEDTGKSDTGFSGSADLTKTFEKGEVALSYRQTVIPAIEYRLPTRARTISLRSSRKMTDKLAASASASYSNFKSIETDDYDTDDLLFNVDLTYSLRPWAGLSLSYSYVNSNDKVINARDYYNNLVFISLRLSYSRRL